MAVTAILVLNFESMGVMTFDASIETGDVFVTASVFLACKLVSALGFITEEGSASSEVVNVGETKTFCNLVIGAITDTAVDLDGRLATLVAV